MRRPITHSLLTFSAIAVAALALGACPDDDQTTGADGATTAATDASVTFDTGGPDTGDASSTGGTLGDAGTSPTDTTTGTTTTDTTGSETSGPCAELGCACTSNADCNSGLCVPGVDGLFCTSACVSTCPSDDFLCMTIALPGADPTNACVPLHPNLCKPCRADAECQNPLRPTATALCLPAADPDEGSFCGSSCADGIACPSGTICSDIALTGGGTAKQCVPNDGLCDCRPAWASLDLVTDCATTNGLGACHGERTCGIAGLTACDAPAPATETCNDKDDDCDGTTDDIAALPCDIDNTFGTCPGTTACDEDGNPICSGRAPTAETCNTINDDCDDATDEGTCADALACTVDACTGPGQCDHTIAPGFCVIAGACVAENAPNPDFPCQRCVPAVSTSTWTGGGDAAACFIGGECWPANAGKPGEPCFRCRPDIATTTWSPAAAADNIACDDGLACTKGDKCNAGGCVGEAYTCGDDRACTDDVCQGDGTCAYPIKAGKCLIGGACYDDDQRADQTTCRVCDATVPTSWSAPDSALACDDGNLCSKNDACAGASCAGTTFSCDDGKVCTQDACLANGTCGNTLVQGFCLIDGACYANGAPNPANPCLVCNAGLVQSGWSLAPANTTCDDGEACTKNDRCGFGACFGTAYSCAGLGCCVGDGTCTTVAPPGAVEDCAGGVDDDCDGLTDEGTPEQCGDVVDNDCDGDTDESANTWGEVFFARPYNDGGVAKIAIYTSNGDGTFQARKLVQMPDDRVYSIVAIGDFDADRFLDLIVSSPAVGPHTRCTTAAQCATGELCHAGVCVNTCTAPAADGCPATVSTKSGACDTGDQCFDIDQYNEANPDRCLPPTQVYLVRERCPDGATELIELGIQRRNFIEYPLLQPGESIQTMVDANNDGQLDMVVRGNWELNTGHTLINQGEGIVFGKLENTIKPRLCCGWANSLSGTPKDIDGDGVVDMVGWCNPNGGSSPAQFSWWKGMGDGFFGVNGAGAFTGLPTTIPNAAAAPAGLMSTADFDRDGDIDIVNGLDDDGNPGAISMLVNRGSGGVLAWATPYVVFDVTPTITSGSDSPGVGNGTSFDFDRDGYPDLLAGWTPEGLCAVGTGFTCAWKEISLIRNLTRQPCGDGMSCNLATDTCQACSASCQGKRCGDDGCGGSCGACPPAEACVTGQCVSKLDCVPQCSGKACGDNGCGGICGRCDPGAVCNAGTCVASCAPQCTQPNGQPKPCGDDGCGGQCIILGDKEIVVQDQSQSAYVVAPSNAPPRLDEALLTPAAPRDVDSLTCTPGDLYDLDRVELHYDWYKNGVFFAGAGDVPLLDAKHTHIGELWHCIIRATDGTEWSIPRRSPTRTISN